jgi:Domain of unknown function (DUF4398)
VLLLALLACGGGESLPETELSRAQLAVERAVAAGAGEQAPSELTRAQSQLTAAREAAAGERYTEARRLAERAESDATLAEARAEAAAGSERLNQLQSTAGGPRELVLPSPSPSAAPAAMPR